LHEPGDQPEVSIQNASQYLHQLRQDLRACAERGELSKAEALYSAGLDKAVLDGQRYALHVEMARVYEKCGDTNRSWTVVSKAILLNPSNREAFDLLLALGKDQQSLERAADLILAAVKECPDNAALPAILAKTYEKLVQCPT